MLNVKKLLLGAVCIVVLTVVIIGWKYLIAVQNYKKTFSDLKISNVDLSKVSDGKYVGSFDTVYVGAEVSVTIKDHKISDIILLNHKNERGKPAEVIPDMVLNSQSLQVDTISGATNSSKAILKAIENALVSSES